MGFIKLQPIDRECSNILSLANGIDNSSIKANTRNNVLKALVKYFNADSGQFCWHNCSFGPDKDNTSLVKLNWKYTDQYINYYHKIDPFLNILPERSACRENDLDLNRNRRNNEFFYDFIKPQNIQHLLVLYIWGSKQILGHIGIHRHSSNPAFTKYDLLQAEYLASAISRKVIQNQLSCRSNELENLLNEFIKEPSQGVVILDSHLHLLHYKTEIAQTGFFNFCDSNGLTISDEPNLILLPDIIQECRQLRKGYLNNQVKLFEKRHATIEVQSYGIIGIDIRIVAFERALFENSNPFYFLITYRPLNGKQSNNNSHLIFNDGLTVKEIEVAGLICEGLTNSEISQRLFISLSTVATHISHIFQKINVQSRSQLIHILLNKNVRGLSSSDISMIKTKYN